MTINPRNDPEINRKFNYVYKITNLINNKIYVGVHRTDDINDGYMGSGLLIKRAQRKYGIENFKKEILQCFPIYKEALEYEEKIVTKDFIDEGTNYNLREGGYGRRRWSKKYLKHLSNMAKKRWKNPEYAKKMRISLKSKYRRKIIGEKVRNWIKNNPEKHHERMLKINKNPEKIEKMRQKHLNSKRTEQACNNIRNGILKAIRNDAEKYKRRSGLGMCYIYNPTTDITKRFPKNEQIPEGWIKGNRESNMNIFNRLKEGIPNG